MFKIEIDAAHRLLRVQLAGYWTLDELERFDTARRVALASTGWEAGAYVCLVDLREHGVQSQDVTVRAHACLTAQDTLPHRLAIVVPGTLAKMQVSRIVRDQKERFFDDPGKAVAWLLLPPETQSAPPAMAPLQAAG